MANSDKTKIQNLIEEKTKEIAYKYNNIIEDEVKKACEKFNVTPKDLIIEFNSEAHIQIKILASTFLINANFVIKN